jgi:hypothetical protein
MNIYACNYVTYSQITNGQSRYTLGISKFSACKVSSSLEKENYDNFVEKGIYHNGSHFSSKLIYLSENLKMVDFSLKYANTGTKQI